MRITIALAISAVLAAATPLSAQQVTLRMRPHDGQVIHYQTTVETYMRGGPMGQVADTTLPFTQVHVWQTGTVSGATDAGFSLHQVMDSMHVESPAMPQIEEMMGQMSDMMRGMATDQQYTTRGAVTRVSVTLPPALQAQTGIAGGMSRSPAGGLSSFVLLPERPVRVGESWRDSMHVQLDTLGTEGSVTVAATFTLERLEGRVAIIGIDGSMSVANPQIADMTFAMTGEESLDLNAGHPTAVTIEMKGEAPAEMGGMPMRTEIQITAQ